MTVSHYLNAEIYQQWYQHSIDNPTEFWGEHANKLIAWSKPWEKVFKGSMAEGDARWFVGGELNASYNCLDRHLPTRADQVAMIWEGDDPSVSQTVTYRELHQRVCRFANVLKHFGIKKGDRVCIYMPMMIDAAVAMLACTRIGAIHSVVFAGFSAEALRERVMDADCRLVITANGMMRGNKLVTLKQYVDEALRQVSSVRKVIVFKHVKTTVAWNNDRDIWYQDIASQVEAECDPIAMEANDPLFILYTSGSTGKPKGILHGTGGYLVYAAMTHKYVFDYHDGDVYWCTADVGWITGHTYSVYGPLLNGGTTLLFEGTPYYPTPARFWETIDKHRVTIFYTAPTAIRALRREGDVWVTQTKRTTLRLLGSVGEPLNPEAWEWYYQVVGEKKSPIVDTWWQTETGGIMITPLPGVSLLKAGSVAKPFFGVKPVIVDDQGVPVQADMMGKLLIQQPWPGMMLSIYGDRERFLQTYFSDYRGNYLTGDQAHCDAAGDYWISGRSDDVIKVSGHRIGTEEVESALIQHHAVSEAAVVGVPDAIKGQHIYAFVSLIAGLQASENLKNELVKTVRQVIGPIATPQHIQFANQLPKTRSGKIMRRLLRKIACNETDDLGDLSTLSDPSVMEDLIRERVQEIE